MKVFFDTNVYVAEALLGGAAERLVTATIQARWRVCCSNHVLEEMHRVLTEKFTFPHRFSQLTCTRIRRRTRLMIAQSPSKHQVPNDAADNPILHAALAAGVDFLVTNDAHLLALNPCQSLRIISMTEYYDLLVAEGHLLP